MAAFLQAYRGRVHEGSRIAWGAVTIDANEPEHLAGFYAALLGVAAVAVGDDRPGWFRIAPGVDGGPAITFQPVPATDGPSPGAHLDLWVDDLDAAAGLVVALGGRRAREVQVFERGRVLVMTDPEGHEFCLVAGPVR
jgi:predicted enzyme related to lactoylglutathione lyase